MTLPSKALVLGATGVLGSHITRHLASYPSLEHLIITGRSTSRLAPLVKACARDGLTLYPEVLFLGNDDHADLVHLRERIEQVGINCMIITMGLHAQTPLGADHEAVDALLRVNLSLPLAVMLGIAPLMSRGHILTLSDAMIHRPMKGYAAYYAAKAGLEAAVTALAPELAPRITINAVAPGIMNVKPGAPKDAEERWSRKVPMGYLGGVAPIVQTIDFLFGNTYITGSVLPVDGGAYR